MSVSHKRRNTDPLDTLDSSSHDSKRRLIENLSSLNINGSNGSNNNSDLMHGTITSDKSNNVFRDYNNINSSTSIDNFKNQVFLGDASSSIRKQHFEKVSNSRSNSKSSRSGSKSPIYNNSNNNNSNTDIDYYNPDEPVYISNIDKFLFDNPDDYEEKLDENDGRITDYSKIQTGNLYIPNTKTINELFHDSARSSNEAFLSDKLKFSYNRIYSQKRREILNNKEMFIRQLQKEEQDKMIDEDEGQEPGSKSDDFELEIANRIKVTNAEIYYDQYMLENYSLIKYYSPFQLIFESLRNWVYEKEMEKQQYEENKIEEIDMVDEDRDENYGGYINSGINNNVYENQTSDYGSYYHTPDIDNDDENMIYDVPMEMD
ncbi:unnamed protein product [[Candida] boidinii]|uniref:Unnamed protein product n=1 Tax=Candida boidinii TaxID=5477 RepID=A0A9W6WBF1_CANBO|nr:hypothetical protein BVG19_g2448 [[Candida] boidinii]OWB53672.1 hypothetical protein B5S27_g5278 [[Candida] boidinii]OWB67052.1 hypothetical protein B5S30_g2404 [[Candida] boidinii]GME74385.1 unnamed protein product [[Candida] boidinii]